jgi:hypothetical protein
MTTYPAVCSGCGAGVTSALWADAGVPIYACGWYPTNPRPCAAAAPRRLLVGNVTRIDLDDARLLLGLYDALEIALVRSVR